VKFGAKIVETRTYEDTGGGRRTDTGHVQVQAQMPVFTQRAKAHDVVIAADEAGVFALWLPYQTWDARPVAGSAGLVPRSWHPALEAWGATQFQNRFEELAIRPMREEDYQTWLALRMIGEAATRTQSADPAKLREFLLSPNFEVAGFKGQKLTLRDWDHQLRQPILLTTGPGHRLGQPAGPVSAPKLGAGHAGHRPPRNRMQIPRPRMIDRHIALSMTLALLLALARRWRTASLSAMNAAMT
jgi:ABC transporter substrate binding protein (PQQ-dependent alcohol dehydrogenase system)